MRSGAKFARHNPYEDTRTDFNMPGAAASFEERGGWGMAHLMASGEVHAGAVILGEATAGDVCIGHRGRAELVVEVHGVAAHASAPDRARNPLGALATLDPGKTQYTVNGLNPRVNYCFTVLAVYSTDTYATSGQICTSRPATSPR